MKLRTINHCLEMLREERDALMEHEEVKLNEARELEPESRADKEAVTKYRAAMDKVHEVQCQRYRIEDMIDDLEERDWK